MRIQRSNERFVAQQAENRAIVQELMNEWVTRVCKLREEGADTTRSTIVVQTRGGRAHFGLLSA